MDKKKSVLLVFGTRPEAIKLVPLINKLKNSINISLHICASAQHRQMLDSVLQEYEILPDFDLDVMKPSQSLDYVTEEVLRGVSGILDELTPDLVIVQGDTSTAFAAALSAFYKQIPIAHVEAGLRSGSIYSPFPEEFNRRAISLMTTYHFAPTERARAALISEGVADSRISVVGNTAIDMLVRDLQRDVSSPLWEKTGGQKYAVITLHRREHSIDELCGILIAIKRIFEKHTNIKAVYPLHKNPLIKGLAEDMLCEAENILLCEPLGSAEFHALLSRSCAVLTDSGGIQEEAAYLGIPTLVLRDNTERAEGVESGNLFVVGTDPENVFKSADTLFDHIECGNIKLKPSFVFGDGHASEKIVEFIEKL